ncbi:MAG: spore maturation protein [Clostridium sp.]|nr:spore maturation protein [Clostridium sp.]
MVKTIIDLLSSWLIPLIIITTLAFGIIKKIPVYETFIEGSKDGLKVAVDIIPYLIAIIVAVSMFRASGAIELAQQALGGILETLKIPVDVLPVMVVRSLSGSAVLGIFSDIANQFGPDSYITKLTAIMVGSSETTFYVLAVYFGAVGIKKFRHALLAGILADIIGIIAAIVVARWLFL